MFFLLKRQLHAHLRGTGSASHVGFVDRRVPGMPCRRAALSDAQTASTPPVTTFKFQPDGRVNPTLWGLILGLLPMKVEVIACEMSSSSRGWIAPLPIEIPVVLRMGSGHSHRENI
jgi:hypothetical protein